MRRRAERTDLVAPLLAKVADNKRAGLLRGSQQILSQKKLPNGSCSGRIVTDVVIDFFEAKKRLLSEEFPAFPPPPILRTLALAEGFKKLLDRGDVNQAGLAHLHGFTRARVTQILNLFRLHPDILDHLRRLAPGPGASRLTERKLRPLLLLAAPQQLDVAHRTIPGFRRTNRSGAASSRPG